MIGLLLMFSSDILINELRVTSYYLYELSLLHELPFTYKLRVTVYCTSYDLLRGYELRVTAYYMSYELPFACELRVTVYCVSYFFKCFL